MYIEHPDRTSLVVALRIAFSSAWIVHWYFKSLSLRISSLSVMPRGRPLNPVETMVLSVGFAITAAHFVEGSLLHVAINSATFMNRMSHLSFILKLYIKILKCQTTAFEKIRHVPLNKQREKGTFTVIYTFSDSPPKMI